MTGEILVAQPTWISGGQQGCCGIATVARLGAIYPTSTSISRVFDKWAKSSNKALLHPSTHDYYSRWTLDRLVKITQVKPANYSGTYPGTSTWHACAIPISIAYAAVLSDMENMKQALYFLSDNMSNAGDHHDGQFSTRYFVNWLIMNNLGAMQTSGPVESRRTQRQIQGWIFTPNWSVCDYMIQDKKNQMLALIKEWNSDPRIKDRQQAQRKADATEAEALNSTIAGGWDLTG